jgi:hypothetical protein
MKRTALVAGLSLALAAPVALAAPPTTTGPAVPAAGKPETKPVAPQAKKGSVLVLVRACVTADATAADAPLAATVLSSNAHAKRAGLTRKTAFTADVSGAKIVLVGKARKQAGTVVRLPRIGGWDNLDQGDVVTLRIRVARTPRGETPAQWATFPTWTSVVDNGPIKRRVCPPAPPAPPA